MKITALEKYSRILSLFSDGGGGGGGSSSTGRFLSLWNCETGLPATNPSDNPYTYKTGDYYIVGTISDSTNYKPTGSSYTTGVASTEVETDTVRKTDIYYYDGSTWMHVSSSSGNVFNEFSSTSTYNAGAYVIYGNGIYKCKTSYTTAGAWDDVKENFVLDESPLLEDAESTTEEEEPSFLTELTKLSGISADEITDGKVVGGMRYFINLTKANDKLEITEIEDSNYETIIILSIGPSVITEKPVTFPSGYKSVGDISYSAGNNYVISIQHGIVVGSLVTTNT